MKTIIITLHNTFAVRNLFRSGVLDVLLKDGGVRVVGLASEEKLEYYRKEFPGIFFERLPVEVRDSWFENFFYLFTTEAIHTQSIKIHQYSRVFRIGSKPDYVLNPFRLVLERLFWHLGVFPWWRPLVRKIYAKIPSNLYGVLFDKYSPDLVFAANMIHVEDYRLLLEAKRRGIKTLGMILSWDNITTKSPLHVFPDRLIVHNSVIKEQAVKYAAYPSEQIIITGIPQYDMYFQNKYVLPRGDFFKRIGADPGKKLILYVASGKASMPVDLDIIDIIQKGIGIGKIKEQSQLLVRPYPRYDFSPEKVQKIKSYKNAVIHSPVEHVGEKSRDDWEYSEDSLKFLVNSLTHSDAVINGCSTFLIEGAIFGKPVISALFDGYQKLGYYQSLRKMFDFEHLAEIKDMGAINFSLSENELYGDINEALYDPEKGAEERKNLVRRQCAFLDGKSAERIGRAITDCFSSKI